MSHLPSTSLADYPNNIKSVQELAEYYKQIEESFGLNPGSFFLNTIDNSSPAHFPQGLFNFFYVQKHNGNLFFAIPGSRKHPNLDFRRSNVMDLIKQAVDEYQVEDFPCTIVGYDDRPVSTYMYDTIEETKYVTITHLDQTKETKIQFYHPEAHIHVNLMKDFSSRNLWYPVLSPCTYRNLYSECIPDFVYSGWSELELDYEEMTAWLLNLNTPPRTNNLGWRGTDNSPREANRRQDLVNLAKEKGYDCKFINEQDTQIENFMSIKDMVQEWRYLIDVSGYGYSGRVKILLHAPRVLFLVWREFLEDFYEYLEPWVHYVPVYEDLSDLEQNLARIQNDPELEKTIIANAQAFAREHLTKAAAVKRMAKRLNGILDINNFIK